MGISASTVLLTLLILLTTTLASDSDTQPNFRTISKAGDVDAGGERVWCVAKNNANDADLQAAIDWACGHGGANCEPIQPNHVCFDGSNIQSTASYVFNDYYRGNGKSEEACNFNGAATISSLDPSHGGCKMEFSTLVVAGGNFTGNSRSSAGETVSKLKNQATITGVFFSAAACFWLIF